MVQASETKFWEQVEVEFMTEESDDPDDPTVIIEHWISWRSKRKDPVIYTDITKSWNHYLHTEIVLIHAVLSEFLDLLDKRYANKFSKMAGQWQRKTEGLDPAPLHHPHLALKHGW